MTTSGIDAKIRFISFSAVSFATFNKFPSNSLRTPSTKVVFVSSLCLWKELTVCFKRFQAFNCFWVAFRFSWRHSASYEIWGEKRRFLAKFCENWKKPFLNNFSTFNFGRKHEKHLKDNRKLQETVKKASNFQNITSRRCAVFAELRTVSHAQTFSI